jgi:hypothetical protein
MALQIAIFLASVSAVVLVTVLVPVLLGPHKQIAEMKTDVKLIVQDSRALSLVLPSCA